uniref:G-protein coupled receptors family 3 profile domain-containing protein n=1 Tax=Setaria digitata TaxID=48799 RepID=A0A915PVH0_9BILA
MKYTKKARGVVMFVDEDQLRRMLSTLDSIRREDSTFNNYFWWIASDSWGIKQSVINGYETVTSGAVTISPDLKVVPDFDRYFKNLRPSNTFLREYWELINCTDKHANFGECFDKHGITFKQEAYVPFVIDAVTVVARALHQYIQASCHSANFRNCNVSKTEFDGARLQSYYRNVSFAPGHPPHIDANGDGIGNYNIYQLNDFGYYVKVGKWIAGKKLDLNVRRVRKGLKNWNGSLPLSVCSADCPRGHYRAYQDQNCCWTCIPCDVFTSIIINETSCVQCPLGYAPNEELVACKLIPPTTLEYNSPWVVLPTICSALGIAATLFVVGVFIRYNSTPVIMASGRELCYCMLGGILLCYSVTFILVSKPNMAVCAASRILIGLSMSAIYAAILTKTNLLARIFLMRGAGRLDCIVPSAQIAICFGIVSIQLIGSLIWLVIDPPGTTVLFPSRKETVLTCKARASHLLISLLYNMFLIIACTLYAFKTRKIPENFNETRLIGFTMYSTSILWLSFGICRNPPGREVKFSWKGDSSCQAVLCVTPTDTLALVLSHDVVVEITLHKHIRICRIGGVAATICSGGRVAAVHHPSIEIVQQETQFGFPTGLVRAGELRAHSSVYFYEFRPLNENIERGCIQVLFDMVQGPRVRATSDTVHVLGVKGTDPSTRVHSITKQEVLIHENLSVATDKFCLRRDIDATVALFLDDVAGGDVLGIYNDKRERCMLAARQAVVDQKGNQLNAIVQGVKVKHDMDSGDTRIYCGRNFISLCVATHALTLHSPWVDINVDRWSRTRLRRGEQIIETGKSRLQISQNSMRADFSLSPSENTDDPSSTHDPKDEEL